MTQNNLGTALQEQGIRAGGQEGAELLSQAVTAYREALKVRTFETLPQDWAMTQNNLGNALSEQGIRTGGQEGAELISQAVTAYREALKVYQFETLPYYWAYTNKNLALAYEAMENWKGAVECYENVLKFDPDNETAYLQASSIRHDRLFEFEKAYQLDAKWVNEQKHSDLSSLANFTEKHFTTARFTEADKMLSAIFTQIKPDDQLYIPLRVIEIANLKVLKKEEAVKAKLADLIEAVKKQPADYRVDWSFSGTRHFVETSDKVAGQREWLLRFLDAVEKEGRDKIGEGLRGLLR
jgi:tetratricopeptide (TPR) repeat protein